MDTEETEVQEEQDVGDIETLSEDEPDIPENKETEPDKEPPVYMEDVKEMVFRRRTEISDLQEKLAKYTDKIEDEITEKRKEINMLDRVANTLPERPIGPLFDPANGSVKEEAPTEDVQKDFPEADETEAEEPPDDSE